MSQNYDHERAVALDAARAAGTLLAQHQRRGVAIEEKGDRDLVSVADRDAEALIRARIAAAFPDDLVVGEEGEAVATATAAGRRRWYVDPLDGTTNFLKGRRWWSTSIGFCDADDRMAVGVVHAPPHGDTYVASRGGGATCNDRPIRCSDVTELREALVSSGFPGPVGPRNVPAWERVIRVALSARVMGGLALDLCAVATGRSDGLWTLDPGPWDCAAGMLVAAEAGAAVTDLAGVVQHAPAGSLVVAAPGIAEGLRRLVASA